MAAALAATLAHSRSLTEFHDLLAAHGVLGPDRRFMHLELDVTNRCNLRCIMCYHSLESVRRARTVHMTAQNFLHAASRMLPHAYYLSLSLGNEPLVSPYFVDILRAVASYDVPNVNFFTNGLLLNEKTIAAIVEYGVTQVCISIDGATPATYLGIRRQGDYDRLLRNVENLVAWRDAVESATPRLRFDIVMMQRNVHELEALVRLAARLGVQQLSFRHLVSFEGLGMGGESLQHTKALSNYWLERALAAAAELGLDVQTCPAFFNLDAEQQARLAATPAPFLPTPYCPFPFFHVSMGPGGHVLACPYSHGEGPYGQISVDTPLDAIWLGPKFTALRQRILDHDPPEMCRRCAFLAARHPDVPEFFVTRRN